VLKADWLSRLCLPEGCQAGVDHEYQTERGMHSALKSSAGDNARNHAIAAHMGYEEPTDLTAAFKKHCSMPPREAGEAAHAPGGSCAVDSIGSGDLARAICACAGPQRLRGGCAGLCAQER